MSHNPPVIGFELGVGEFRIVTAEAVYHIRVLPELVTANTRLGVVSRLPADAAQPLPPSSPAASVPVVQAAQALAASTAGPGDHAFFQELSQELFQSVGQLARQLSVSVGELPVDAPAGDLTKTGADLEDAKGQLEDVIELTERASMTIMDLADQIQADMDSLNGQMDALNNLESLLDGRAVPAGPAPGGSVPPAAPGGGGGVPVSAKFMDKFVEIQACIDRLAGGGVGHDDPEPLEPPPDEEPEPVPAAPEEPVTVTTFDLDTVFQTLYEFCTNESVKAHVKSMRESCSTGGFKVEAVEAELSRQSESLTADEDGFFNFPIPGLLKLLYSNAATDEFKQILKKMNQTVDSIFLEPNLPVEGREVALAPEAAPAPPAPAAPAPPPPALVPAAGPGPASAGMAELGGLMRELEELLPRGGNEAGAGPAAPAGGGPAGAPGGDGLRAAIPEVDRDAIVHAVEESRSLIKNTSRHLTHIMEALSFQDLSGQRIKKIVGLISDIQVRLLSLLVSFDSKMRAHTDAPQEVRPREEREKVAQAEVDKMLEKLNAEPSEMRGPGAENRLDQGAVNDLLAGLGF
ncbi:MAG: protein phosphatase CheZ [Deltaproteobacteria bacterium]|jgi:chemotaxis regulatin CheY-phosphate phosphatase CheZ|nr:protein phosphatase CheZ [Deltaproteobacteria bacterium]